MIRARVVRCPHCLRRGALEVVRYCEPAKHIGNYVHSRQLFCLCVVECSRWLRTYPLHRISNLLGAL